MAISFPTSPADNEPYTEGSLTWKYTTSDNSWTVQTLSQAGLDNSVNHNKEIVFLVNTDNTINNLTPSGTGLRWNATTRTLKIRQDETPLTYLTFEDSTGVILNMFNERGVLDKAGRIFYHASDPTPHADDTGLLWYDTVNSSLGVWNGTTWDTAAGNVSTGNEQTFVEDQTFQADVLLSGSADIASTGASSTLRLKARDGSNVKKNGISITNTAVTVHPELDVSSLSVGSKNIIATLADDQTIAGQKTFTAGILSNSMLGTGYDVKVLADDTANSRGITVKANSSTSGIIVKATNASNQGSLSVTGKTIFGDDVDLTSGKTLYSHSTVSNTVSYGQFNLTSGTTTLAQTQITPPNLGPLTMTAITGAGTSQSFTVTNNGTQTVGFYYTREQRRDDADYRVTCGTFFVRVAAGVTLTLGVSSPIVSGPSPTYDTYSGSGTGWRYDIVRSVPPGIDPSVTSTHAIAIKLEMAGVVTL